MQILVLLWFHFLVELDLELEYQQMSWNWNCWNWVHYWNQLHCWNWYHIWNWFHYRNWFHKRWQVYAKSVCKEMSTSLLLKWIQMTKHNIKLALLPYSSIIWTKLELVPALESIPQWNWFHHGDELELQNLYKCPKSNSGTGSSSGITTTLA